MIALSHSANLAVAAVDAVPLQNLSYPESYRTEDFVGAIKKGVLF